MTRYLELYMREQQARETDKQNIAALQAQLDLLKRFITDNDLETHLAEWATGAEHSVGERLKRYGDTLEIIAGSAQDKLHMIQAKAALDNIGAKVA